MILDVFRCSQLFSDVFIWVVTFIESLPVQCITTPRAHILWSSLYVVGNIWQDQDASVGNRIGPNSTMQGVLEAIGKPLVAAFLSHLEVSWRFKVSVRLLYCFLAVVQLMNKIGFLQVEYFYHCQVIQELVWSEITTGPDRTGPPHRNFSVRLLKSSSK